MKIKIFNHEICVCALLATNSSCAERSAEMRKKMKKSRHQKIKELIDQFEIETQEELAERLRGAGCNVTQATVSRDIRELKLTKVSMGDGRQKYTILAQSDHYLNDKYIRVLKDGFVSMDMAQNILVVKTVSGMAMAVAAAIDAMKLKEIVGSIAGDDTIMMAVKTVEDTQIIMGKIRGVMDE